MKLLSEETGRYQNVHWYRHGFEIRITPRCFEVDMPRELHSKIIDEAVEAATKNGCVIDHIEINQTHVFVHCRHNTPTILFEYDESDLVKEGEQA